MRQGQARACARPGPAACRCQSPARALRAASTAAARPGCPARTSLRPVCVRIDNRVCEADPGCQRSAGRPPVLAGCTRANSGCTRLRVPACDRWRPASCSRPGRGTARGPPPAIRMSAAHCLPSVRRAARPVLNGVVANVQRRATGAGARPGVGIAQRAAKAAGRPRGQLRQALRSERAAQAGRAPGLLGAAATRRCRRPLPRARGHH